MIFSLIFQQVHHIYLLLSASTVPPSFREFKSETNRISP